MPKSCIFSLVLIFSWSYISSTQANALSRTGESYPKLQEWVQCRPRAMSRWTTTGLRKKVEATVTRLRKKMTTVKATRMMTMSFTY